MPVAPSNAKSPVVDVFSYLDYRELLRDYYDAKKAEGRGFSYRAFSRRIGVRSPNHLKRVTDGERGLTPQMATRYAEAMKLGVDEARYFCDLVRFTQAEDSEEREEAYGRLRAFRQYQTAHWLELKHAAYHATWYVPAIREMALLDAFRPDPAWIAKRLRPKITTAQARSALELLADLGFLVADDDGQLSQADPLVTTGPEVRGLHIRKYHHMMLERAVASMDLFPADERDISALTFCVGKDGAQRIKERVRAFRRELIAMLTEEKHGTEVLQLNMQLFPLTKAPAKANKPAKVASVGAKKASR